MAFSDEDINKVWAKGTTVPGYDSSKYRKDSCDAWMERAQYGNRDSKYGWEIDHIVPGGTDSLSNLRPLQWENNLSKSDGRLVCAVTSSGNTNVTISKR